MNTLTSFHKKFKYGFTLIELLLVIGIIAILAAIVIVAINPTKQLGDARDSQRRSDVNTLLNASYQYAIDNNGTFPDALGTALAVDGTEYVVCLAATAGCSTSMAASVDKLATGTRAAGTFSGIHLGSLVGDYLTALPSDPRFGGVTNAGVALVENSNYSVVKSATGRLTFTALAPEQDTGGISVER